MLFRVQNVQSWSESFSGLRSWELAERLNRAESLKERICVKRDAWVILVSNNSFSNENVSGNLVLARIACFSWTRYRLTTHHIWYRITNLLVYFKLFFADFSHFFNVFCARIGGDSGIVARSILLYRILISLIPWTLECIKIIHNVRDFY